MQRTNSKFMTYDEYVDDIRAQLSYRDGTWEYHREAIKLLRKHGGSEFADFAGFLGEQGPRPSSMEIPDRPILELLAPYSRVTLVSRSIHYDVDYFHSLMIVFRLSGDDVEGYIDRKSYAEAGRITVHKDKIIECMKPVMPGEVDPDVPDGKPTVLDRW